MFFSAAQIFLLIGSVLHWLEYTGILLFRKDFPSFLM